MAQSSAGIKAHRQIDVDERALAPMRAYFERRGVELTAARMRMARIPFGAELVENSVSIAPGFMLGNVIVMAGIPRIMQVMLDSVSPRLRTGRKMLSRSTDTGSPRVRLPAQPTSTSSSRAASHATPPTSSRRTWPTIASRSRPRPA